MMDRRAYPRPEHLLLTIASLKRTRPRHYQVFMSRAYDKKTYREIGNELGVGLERARQIYHRALQIIINRALKIKGRAHP